MHFETCAVLLSLALIKSNYGFVYELLKYESQSLVKHFESKRNNATTPLSLVFLPESFEAERCLDGSPFGYYIRRSVSILNSRKWIFLLEGGGLCVEPIDCIVRKNTDEGSSLFWEETFIPGTDGLKDILSDNPQENPYFYDYNHDSSLFL